jgi:hypothetical protein
MQPANPSACLHTVLLACLPDHPSHCLPAHTFAVFMSICLCLPAFLPILCCQPILTICLPVSSYLPSFFSYLFIGLPSLHLLVFPLVCCYFLPLLSVCPPILMVSAYRYLSTYPSTHLSAWPPFCPFMCQPYIIIYLPSYPYLCCLSGLLYDYRHAHLLAGHSLMHLHAILRFTAIIIPPIHMLSVHRDACCPSKCPPSCLSVCHPPPIHIPSFLYVCLSFCLRS